MAASGVAGSLLVFGDRLDALVHRELYEVGTPGKSAPLEQVVRAAEAAAAGKALRLRLAGSQTPVHEVWIECDTCQRVWVDPSTAVVRGVRSAHGTTRTFLHEFHRRMFLGKLGERMVGFAGLGLALLTISGVVLAWPRKFRFITVLKVKLTAGWRRMTYDAHRAVGLIVAPLLLISALTGAYFIFHRVVEMVLVPAAAPTAASRAIVPVGARRSADELFRVAVARFPEAEPTWLTFPTKPDEAFVVRFRQAAEDHPNGRTFVRLDPYRGDIVSVIDAYDSPQVQSMLNNLYPLHIGATGGVAHRVLLVVVGLLPFVFFVSGIALWVTRGGSSFRRFSRRS